MKYIGKEDEKIKQVYRTYNSDYDNIHIKTNYDTYTFGITNHGQCCEDFGIKFVDNEDYEWALRVIDNDTDNESDTDSDNESDNDSDNDNDNESDTDNDSDNDNDNKNDTGSDNDNDNDNKSDTETYDEYNRLLLKGYYLNKIKYCHKRSNDNVLSLKIKTKSNNVYYIYYIDIYNFHNGYYPHNYLLKWKNYKDEDTL